jgi:hypothetical protein
VCSAAYWRLNLSGIPPLTRIPGAIRNTYLSIPPEDPHECHGPDLCIRSGLYDTVAKMVSWCFEMSVIYIKLQGGILDSRQHLRFDYQAEAKRNSLPAIHGAVNDK